MAPKGRHGMLTTSDERQPGLTTLRAVDDMECAKRDGSSHNVSNCRKTPYVSASTTLSDRFFAIADYNESQDGKPGAHAMSKGGWVFRIGRMAGTALRKGKWAWASATGDEQDAIRAEEELGRDLAMTLLEEVPQDADRAGQERVAEWGDHLVSRLRRSNRRFTFRVVTTDEINAFALPGGFIFVTRKLLDLCGWDRDEAGFVLAHEMAHVIKGHAFERTMTDLALNSVGRVLPQGRLLRSKVIQVATTFAGKAYSRNQEFEADLYGLKLMRSGGLDLQGAERLLQRLADASDPDDEQNPLVAYLSTHPPARDRIAALRRQIVTWRKGR